MFTLSVSLFVNLSNPSSLSPFLWVGLTWLTALDDREPILFNVDPPWTRCKISHITTGSFKSFIFPASQGPSCGIRHCVRYTLSFVSNFQHYHQNKGWVQWSIYAVTLLFHLTEWFHKHPVQCHDSEKSIVESQRPTKNINPNQC